MGPDYDGHDAIDHISHSIFLPIVLLINYGIFQYLVLLFHKQARRPYVALLLFVSAIASVSLIPFSTQSEETIEAMNDVSESCLALMLLVQTAFSMTEHHDYQAKQPPDTAPRARCVRDSIRVLSVMKHVANLLILLDCVVVVLGIIGIFSPSAIAAFGGATDMNNRTEDITLAYTFVYRFGALWLVKGTRAMLREDGVELLAHVLFVCHEYPFLVVFKLTGVNLEHLQGLVMRLTLIPCVWLTIGEHHYRHPTTKQLHRLSQPALQDLVRRVSDAIESKTRHSSRSIVRALDESGPLALLPPEPLKLARQ